MSDSTTDLFIQWCQEAYTQLRQNPYIKPHVLTAIQTKLYSDGLQVLPDELAQKLPSPPWGCYADRVHLDETIHLSFSSAPRYERYFRVRTALERVIAWANQQADDSLPSPTTTQPAEYVFHRDGDGWFIRAFGEQGHFRNLVGLEYIAMLLERPDTPVPVVYLVGGRVGRTTVKDAQAVGLSVGTSRQPVADKGMLADIKRKMEDCRQDIEKAERHGDLVSAEIGREELGSLTAQWLELTRPGGRSRDFDSDTEKMRKRILQGLRRAYEALGEGRMPRTERHFEQAITYQEGSYIYRASPRPDWMVKK